jgi:N-acetyl-gamma-glutamyl-phosphate reductase
MTKIAIIGASGYSGEELLRILLRHPECEITTVTSRQYAGKVIGEVFPRFAESGLTFTAPDVAEIAKTADVAFLSLPHGLAAEFAEPLFDAGVKVIDISADFRVRNPKIYKKYYKVDHPAPHLLKEAVYGLPEVYGDKIANASLVACAGCYPTSILLPSIPLLKAGLVDSKGLVVASMSGVTGAGRKVDLPFIFPEANESVKAYAVSGHRHLSEIEQELALAAGSEVRINFIPHLMPMNRGINSTLVYNVPADFAPESIAARLAETYADKPFVRILAVGSMADTKHVTMTNFCEIGHAFDEHTGNLIITSVIDNLTKGAAGQAVQCMNIMLGIDETTGLR